MIIAANSNYRKDIEVETVMVRADEVDDHAIKFYHSTGAAGENVIHFNYRIILK